MQDNLDTVLGLMWLEYVFVIGWVDWWRSWQGKRIRWYAWSEVRAWWHAVCWWGLLKLQVSFPYSGRPFAMCVVIIDWTETRYICITVLAVSDEWWLCDCLEVGVSLWVSVCRVMIEGSEFDCDRQRRTACVGQFGLWTEEAMKGPTLKKLKKVGN